MKNGICAAAKQNATIANHTNILKFVKTELVKCDHDSGPIQLMNASNAIVDWSCTKIKKDLGSIGTVILNAAINKPINAKNFFINLFLKLLHFL